MPLINLAKVELFSGQCMRACQTLTSITRAPISPRNPLARLILPDGLNVACRIIDLSASGAAIKSEYRPEVGALVTLGKTPGRVVRHLEEGFAIEFTRLQHADLVEDSVTNG